MILPSALVAVGMSLEGLALPSCTRGLLNVTRRQTVGGLIVKHLTETGRDSSLRVRGIRHRSAHEYTDEGLSNTPSWRRLWTRWTPVWLVASGTLFMLLGLGVLYLDKTSRVARAMFVIAITLQVVGAVLAPLAVLEVVRARKRG